MINRKYASQICLLVIAAILPQTYCWGSKKNVTLHFPDATSEKKISIKYHPMGIMNYFYEPYIKKYTTNEGAFTIEIPDSISTFQMSIESTPPCLWAFHLPIDLGREETLDICLDTITPRFRGDNSKGYDLLFGLKTGSGNSRADKVLEEFNKKSEASFFDFINGQIQTNIDELKSLSENKSISDKFFAFAQDVVIDEYLFLSGMLAWGVNHDKNLIREDSVRFFTDLNKLYNLYDGYYGLLSLPGKAGIMKKGFINGRSHDLNLWNEDQPFDYLTKDEQEIMKVSETMTSVGVGMLDSLKLEKEKERFKAVYPNSRYIPLLNELKASESKSYFLANMSEDKGLELYGQFKSDNLHNITKMFVGPRPVLVDFWATWCGPCIKEFDYRPELDKFLTENNIGMLFVSIDFSGAYSKWETVIKEKKLDGLHYFGTDEFGEKLTSIKLTTIPRFVLLDKDGNVLIESCELPSSGKLIPQIKEKLGL